MTLQTSHDEDLKKTKNKKLWSQSGSCCLPVCAHVWKTCCHSLLDTFDFERIVRTCLSTQLMLKHMTRFSYQSGCSWTNCSTFLSSEQFGPQESRAGNKNTFSKLKNTSAAPHSSFCVSLLQLNPFDSVPSVLLSAAAASVLQTVINSLSSTLSSKQQQQQSSWSNTVKHLAAKEVHVSLNTELKDKISAVWNIY